MKKTYSEKDLVRFIYQETSHQENIDLAYLVEDHAQMNETYHLLTQAKVKLDEMLVRPSSRCINKVLAYAGS